MKFKFKAPQINLPKWKIFNKFKEKTKEIDLSGISNRISLGSLIGGFIVLGLGVSMLPTISKEITSVAASQNSTGAAATFLSITPFFWVVMIIISTLLILFQTLRNTGEI